MSLVPCVTHNVQSTGSPKVTLCVETFGLPVKWEVFDSTRICESFQSRIINFIWLWNVQRTARSRYSIDFWTNHIAKLLLIQSKCSNTRHGHVNNVTAAARDETWREFVSKSLENWSPFQQIYLLCSYVWRDSLVNKFSKTELKVLCDVCHTRSYEQQDKKN